MPRMSGLIYHLCKAIHYLDRCTWPLDIDRCMWPLDIDRCDECSESVKRQVRSNIHSPTWNLCNWGRKPGGKSACNWWCLPETFAYGLQKHQSCLQNKGKEHLIRKENLVGLHEGMRMNLSTGPPFHRHWQPSGPTFRHRIQEDKPIESRIGIVLSIISECGWKRGWRSDDGGSRIPFPCRE